VYKWNKSNDMQPYPDPLTVLLFAGALIVIAVMFFWWGKKIVEFWLDNKKLSDRMLGEDALKHIYNATVTGQKPTMRSIAGSLQVSLDRTSALLNNMEQRRLIVWKDNELQLTPEGQEYALHIIRAHRLWERYLADHTGLKETEWHTEAEKREHQLTPRETEVLFGRLGHPTHDPHGDPIPTLDGGLEGHGGAPLTTLSPGQAARIVHTEDEPEAIYAQLVAEGLAPGMELHVLEKTPQLIRFWADGTEHILAPMVANNLSVVPTKEADITEVYTGAHLSDLKPGERGRVLGISRICRGDERRRLLDLGLTAGTIVEAEMTGPGGSPTAYLIREAIIALRPEQARFIHIKKLDPEAEDEKDKSQIESGADQTGV
jgi:DtxR family Mn-dependent transcriptional regulator